MFQSNLVSHAAVLCCLCGLPHGWIKKLSTCVGWSDINCNCKKSLCLVTLVLGSYSFNSSGIELKWHLLVQNYMQILINNQNEIFRTVYWSIIIGEVA